MRISPRSLLPQVVIAAVVLFGSLAFSQSVFTCSSDDMGLHTCRVGPNQGIQFLRQRSDSACVAGRTYGINRDGVWVNNGCRADFQVMQNGYNNGQYSQQGAWNGHRDRDNDHDADDQYRHHHDRDYNDGQYNTGTYNNGSYNNGQYNGNNPYYNGQYNRGNVNSGQIQYLGRYDDGKSTCESQPGQGQTFCQSGGPFRDAYLVKQNGQNPCVRGRNWDVDPNHGLWIADGCSGQFKIEK
jgi:Protein of unknown function (DUF3011)